MARKRDEEMADPGLRLKIQLRVGGGAIAAPIFARVMSNVLRLLNVPPTNTREAA